MIRPSVIFFRRLLVLLAFAGFLAALLLWGTGGFSYQLGPFRGSARNADRPALASAVLLLFAWLLSLLPSGRTDVAAEGAWWRAQPGRVISAAWRLVRRRPDPVITLALLAAVLDVVQWQRGVTLWLDEQMIAINIRDRGFAGLAGTLWLGQSAPLGWLWLQRAMLLVFGSGELTLRFVPLAFGLATLAAAAWIGRRWLSTWSACVFVVLCWIGSSLSHYRFEVKHYSADVFWALWLPALAVWAAEPDTGAERWRRQALWVAMAGAGLWFANGALFVAPACLLWFLWPHLRGRDRSGLVRFLAASGIWLVLFAGHYALSLRFTHENTFLREHWADRFPSTSAGAPGLLSSIVTQLAEVARDAGGAHLPLALWTAGIAGLAFARPRPLAVLSLAVPLTGVALAVLGFVPLYGRFSVWMIPALYLGVAACLDSAAARLFAATRRRVVTGLASIAAVLAGIAAADVSLVGWRNLDIGVPTVSHHALDDRAGVAWLMRHRQPGDAIVTTRLGWPAIWWYGGISLARHPDGSLGDGTSMYEIGYYPNRHRCDRFADLLPRHRRVLLFVSFPDGPDDVYAVAERQLLARGELAARAEFASRTRVAVFRLLDPGTTGTSGSDPPDHGPGCFDVVEARRW